MIIFDLLDSIAFPKKGIQCIKKISKHNVFPILLTILLQCQFTRNLYVVNKKSYKKIYTLSTEQQAQQQLGAFGQKWDKKYQTISQM
jgi:hypothetical protein